MYYINNEIVKSNWWYFIRYIKTAIEKAYF